tara:strand:- start:185 stop:496 length:312 start_codon:yes stop_codon:yes gene_type:complete
MSNERNCKEKTEYEILIEKEKNEIMEKIKKDVLEKHSRFIFPWFQYGTLWVNRIDNEIAKTIRYSIEDFYIFDKSKTQKYTSVVVSLSAPTEREPWNEYAFDF